MYGRVIYLKKSFFLLLFICISLIILSYFSLEHKENITVKGVYKTHVVKNITVDEAYLLIESNKNILILDVRNAAEYSKGHLKNAILIPYDQLQNKINSLAPHKNSPILVYCRSGRRSDMAVTVLLQNKFTNIYHMYQGFSAWTYEIAK